MKPDAVIADFHDGAYGPTIRIDVQRLEDLQLIRSLFTKLARGSISEIDLRQSIEAAWNGLATVVLLEGDGPLLGRLGDKKRLPQFHWFNSRKDWLRCARLCRALIYGGPWHQYLCPEGVHEAVVELAFMEPRP